MDNKGFSLIELLGSLVILGLIVAGFYHFYESYQVDLKGQHEYETAKNLAIRVSEESIKGYKDGVYVGVGEINNQQFSLKGTEYNVKTIVSDETTTIGVINSSVPINKFQTIVNWKTKTLEVNAYVTK
jgi:prepilin-type N-terminal cleavage/methylation domain-containing protein